MGQNQQRNIFSYHNHIVLALHQTKAISTGKPVLANSWKTHSLTLEGKGTLLFTDVSILIIQKKFKL